MNHSHSGKFCLRAYMKSLFLSDFSSLIHMLNTLFKDTLSTIDVVYAMAYIVYDILGLK